MKNRWMLLLKACVGLTLLSDMFISHLTFPYLAHYYGNYVAETFNQDLINLITQYSLFNLINSGLFVTIVVYLHFKQYSKQTHTILFFIFFLNVLPKTVFAFIYLKPFPWIQVTTALSAFTLFFPIFYLLPRLFQKAEA